MRFSQFLLAGKIVEHFFNYWNLAKSGQIIILQWPGTLHCRVLQYASDA